MTHLSGQDVPGLLRLLERLEQETFTSLGGKNQGEAAVEGVFGTVMASVFAREIRTAGRTHKRHPGEGP